MEFAFDWIVGLYIQAQIKKEEKAEEKIQKEIKVDVIPPSPLDLYIG